MIKAIERVFPITIILCALAGLTIAPTASAAVKFRHAVSIYSDAKGKDLQQPEGVACNSKFLLIVADTGNGRLLRYTLQGGEVKGGAEIRIPQLSNPFKTKINSNNVIYTIDSTQRRIIRLSPEGEFIGYLNPSGLPSPESYVPISFDIDSLDNIYVLDIFSERVLVLDSEGKYQKHIKFPREYGFFSDLAVDFKRTVLLIDSVNGTVFAAADNSGSFSPLSKSLKKYVRFPARMATDSRGRVYVADRNGGSIISLGQDGSYLGQKLAMGWREGFLNHPSQMCINNEGEIFIADTSNNRIQIFVTVE